MSRLWFPHGTRTHPGSPPVGSLIASSHAVWRVVTVTNRVLSDGDRDVWIKAGMPDVDTWAGRPYRVDVEHVGGARPGWATTDQDAIEASMDVPATAHGRHVWQVYRGDRWPMCSCCGEPVPCRAELQDQEIDLSLQQVGKLMAKQPGYCWHCDQPITARQKSIVYPGNNLDLPGGPEVVFHTRQGCHGAAQEYEQRWIAVDPRHERILTWPHCGGILVVHADGSSECRSGRSYLGEEAYGEPNCRGHLTHDHTIYAACYAVDMQFSHSTEKSICPRGCPIEGHPGIRTTPRPARPSQAELFH